MFGQRAIVALITGPIFLVAAYFGGWIFFLAVTSLLLVATVEYARMMRVLKHCAPAWLMVPSVLAVLVAAQLPQLNLMGLSLFLAALATLIYALWLFERGISLDAALDWFAMLAGIVLLGWIGGHFFLIRALPEQAWQWTALAMMSIWAADIGAYLVGRFVAGRFVLGRHTLVPRLSPKKTVEGYIGGIVLGSAVTIGVAAILGLSLPLAAIAGLSVGVLGLFGDLSISLIKREAGLKDSGTLFPGHGGALDRLDSLIWAVAIVYYVVVFLGPQLASGG